MATHVFLWMKRPLLLVNPVQPCLTSCFNTMCSFILVFHSKWSSLVRSFCQSSCTKKFAPLPPRLTWSIVRFSGHWFPAWLKWYPSQGIFLHMCAFKQICFQNLPRCILYSNLFRRCHSQFWHVQSNFVKFFDFSTGTFTFSFIVTKHDKNKCKSMLERE